jgi:hypothetical protein
MIEISCTVTIESFHLMTFILESVLFAFNYFIVTTGTLIPSTTTVPQVSTKSSPIVASHSSTVLPESTTSSEKQTTETTTLEMSTGKTTVQAGTKTTTESLMTTRVSATITSGISTPVQLSTTTPVGGSSARSTVEKLSTRTIAVLASPRMTTSPTQPSVPATTGKQRICHLSKSFECYCHQVIYEASVYLHFLKSL